MYDVTSTSGIAVLSSFTAHRGNCEPRPSRLFLWMSYDRPTIHDKNLHQHDEEKEDHLYQGGRATWEEIGNLDDGCPQ